METIAQAPDEAALGVLGDYWIERVDEARGAFVHLQIGDAGARLDLADEETRLAAHARGWIARLVAAGFREDLLVLDNGFVQTPLLIEEGSALDGDPDIVRLSPRYYLQQQALSTGVEFVVHEGRALTPRTSTRVAIKRPRFDEGNIDAVLAHELRAIGMVTSPHVPRVIGKAVGIHGTAVVLEWCGIDLRRLVRLARRHERTMHAAFTIAVGLQLCDALAATHAARIIHREVRADHVAVAEDGTVRLIDFGSAMIDGEQLVYAYVSPGIVRDIDRRVRYMSPEQARGEPLDERTDVFSLAGLLVELATNVHPAGTGTTFEVLERIVRTQLEPPASLPPRLRLALRAGLERQRDARATVAELRAMLVEAAREDRLDVGRELVARTLLENGVPV